MSGTETEEDTTGFGGHYLNSRRDLLVTITPGFLGVFVYL